MAQPVVAEITGHGALPDVLRRSPPGMPEVVGGRIGLVSLAAQIPARPRVRIPSDADQRSEVMAIAIPR